MPVTDIRWRVKYIAVGELTREALFDGPRQQLLHSLEFLFRERRHVIFAGLREYLNHVIKVLEFCVIQRSRI